MTVEPVDAPNIKAFKDIVKKVGMDFVWHTQEGDMPGRGLASILQARISVNNKNNARSGRLPVNITQGSLLVTESDLVGQNGESITLQGERFVMDFQGIRDGLMHIHLKPEAAQKSWR